MIETESRTRQRKLGMASPTNILTESLLKCSICLDVFDKPVSTLCGHNFCRKCIQLHLNYNEVCPLCKTFLIQRSDLRINTTLSEIAENFKKSIENCTDECSGELGKVACDVCTSGKLNAVKTCLMCLTSYCKKHLKPHTQFKRFRKHKLVDPVEDLEDRLCQTHERPLELFCRDEQICICLMCVEKDHNTHKIVTAETECKNKKEKLGDTKAEMQTMIRDRRKKVEEIKQSVELSETSTQKESNDIKAVFQAVMCAAQKAQDEIITPIEEKQREVGMEAEVFMKKLEEEIAELMKRISAVEQFSSNEDHINFLQNLSSLQPPPDLKELDDITVNTDLCLGTVRRHVSRMLQSIHRELEELPSIELKRIQKYSEDVTLDPKTAHPSLVMSWDRKQVKDGDQRQDCPDDPERFDHFGSVMGSEGFTSGRRYWEVGVVGKTGWDIGVARESISRKGQLKLCPEKGFWALMLCNGSSYNALTDPPTPLRLDPLPQKVGVFVDYEEGQVSFYNVEERSHIYTFTDTFTEKLYPYFSPHLIDGGKNVDPLIISSTDRYK
ncbi:E3 ubiquitin-protein ligase TRIM39 [Amia ocellicauda]|uniref:E3 ubiquitin-protein ligase TRIM39 n=1 Tax=Amia ocellicauda TaxID=2972642 RepID=UPI00346496E3